MILFLVLGLRRPVVEPGGGRGPLVRVLRGAQEVGRDIRVIGFPTGSADIVRQGRFGGEGAQLPILDAAQNWAKTWIGGFRLGTNIAIDADATVTVLRILGSLSGCTWTFGSPLDPGLTGGMGRVCRYGQIQWHCVAGAAAATGLTRLGKTGDFCQSRPRNQ